MESVSSMMIEKAKSWVQTGFFSTKNKHSKTIDKMVSKKTLPILKYHSLKTHTPIEAPGNSDPRRNLAKLLQRRKNLLLGEKFLKVSNVNFMKILQVCGLFP